MNVLEDTYLPDILHDIAQALLGPTMVIIIAMLLVSLVLLGQIIAEFFTERRHYKQNVAQIINQINDADYGSITRIVTESALLRFQKAALIMVSRNMGLPEEALLSMASTQLENVEGRYKRRVAVTDTISKIAPMLGLMGTLIPLGPGIVAMGQGNISTLSSSLLVAFDATVCGLVVAVFSLVLSKIRTLWYAKYTNTLESLMNCIIEQADIARKQGVSLPAGYTGNPLVDYQVKNGAATAANAGGVPATSAGDAPEPAKSAGAGGASDKPDGASGSAAPGTPTAMPDSAAPDSQEA